MDKTLQDLYGYACDYLNGKVDDGEDVVQFGAEVFETYGKNLPNDDIEFACENCHKYVNGENDGDYTIDELVEDLTAWLGNYFV